MFSSKETHPSHPITHPSLPPPPLGLYPSPPQGRVKRNISQEEGSGRGGGWGGGWIAWLVLGERGQASCSHSSFRTWVATLEVDLIEENMKNCNISKQIMCRKLMRQHVVVLICFERKTFRVLIFLRTALLMLVSFKDTSSYLCKTGAVNLSPPTSPCEGQPSCDPGSTH